MARRFPKDLFWTKVVLEVDNPWCELCGSKMYKCDHRPHRIFTFEVPRHLVCKLVRCSNQSGPNRHRTLSPEKEALLTMPRWLIGWDVFCWLGYR
ncbi:MAG: hypothetical protein ACFCD0_27105 [Gemmataceae bacterium]